MTLFGESAGAVAVSLHLLHRRSWDKFEKAILQSGTMNLPYIFSGDEGLRRAHTLHTKLGCPAGNKTDVRIERNDAFRILFLFCIILLFSLCSGGSRISRRGGGVDLRCGCFLAKLYVKTKEFGPVGGRAPGTPP